MAAALTKTLRHNHNSSIKYIFTNTTKHSTPDPLIAQKNIPAHQLIQCKWRSRFPQTPNFNKNKYLHFSAPTTTTSKFGLVGWYLGLIKTRPVATKSITSALIYTAADLSSQTIMGETSEKYDFLRTLRMAGYGMFIIGPSLHFWFNFVSRAFPSRDLLSTFKKITLAQIVYAPAIYTLFFSVNAALQGENGPEIIARLKRDLVPTMISGIMYWPVCDFVTFKFIPVHLQPLVGADIFLKQNRPALIVSSTSWTPDEDFGILLEAAVMYDRRVAVLLKESDSTGDELVRDGKQFSYPRLLFIITGKGPEKEKYEQKLKKLSLKRVAFRTM